MLPVSLINFVERTDVGMVQCGCGSGLTLETLQGLRILGQLIGKELQGNVATELGILRFVHPAHSAAAQLAENSVMRDGFADHAGTGETPERLWPRMLGHLSDQVNLALGVKPTSPASACQCLGWGRRRPARISAA